MAKVEPFYRHLGDVVFELRKRKGLTQEDLGAKLRPPTTRANIANIENGKQRTLVHTLMRIADVLGVRVGDLLDEANAHARKKK